MMIDQTKEQISLWIPRQTAVALRVMAALRQQRIGQVVDDLVVDAAHAQGVMIHAIPPTPAPTPEIVPMT